MNPKVDAYIDRAGKWKEEVELLRNIVLDCGLTEELKWGTPCYTYPTGSGSGNIILIHTFKEYCALLFFKGALLDDPDNILVQQTENVQSARQARFTNAKEIKKQSRVLKSYIYQAIEVEKAGMKVQLKKTAAYDVPEEFQKRLHKMPKLKKAFDTLTPGRQRAYLLHFSAPKQSKTREARIEKFTKHILEGKGLNDQ